MTSQWRIAPYHPSRRRQVLELMALVQGHRTSEEEFSWWFERDPSGYLNIYLAEDEGGIIAVSSTSAYRIWLDGREHLVPFSLNVLTHPAHRGRGIFTKLELANEADARERGCGFMLSFPNRISTPIFLRKLGWTAGRVPPVMVKPRRPGRLAAALFGSARLGRAAGWTSALAGWAFRRTLPLGVERIDGFEAEFDELWRSCRGLRRWGLVRDARYLNWRFLEAPGRRYRCFRVLDGGDTVGYVVSGVAEKRGIRLGYIADMLLAASSRGKLGAALAAAEASVVEDDVDAFLAFAPPDPSGVWDRMRALYVPIPKRFSFIYKVFDPALAGLPWRDPGRWRFELGDLDFF